MSSPRRVLLVTHRELIAEIGGRHGVTNVRLVGSVARGVDDEDSDIDLLVDYPGRVGGFAFELFRLEVEQLLGVPVDTILDEGDSPVVQDMRAQAIPLEDL